MSEEERTRVETPEGPFIDLAHVPPEEDDRSGSRMFFPLRTGVELFSDPSMPEAVARAKQAAVLYDEIVFETGLYEVSIGSEGSNDWWFPLEMLTDERIRVSRRVRAAGERFSVAVGLDEGGPVNEIINSPLVAGYASQYHSGILDDLAAFEPEWVKQVTLGSNPLPMSTPEGKLLRHLERRDKRDEALMPEARRGDGYFRRDWIIKTFNRDATISSMIGATFNPTSLFGPMVRRRDLREPRDGRTALEILAPNVGALPWEAVMEFRDHPGSTEARARLREFEEKVATEEPEDALAFLMGVAQEVTDATFGAMQALRPNWPERVAAEVLGTVVGFMPEAGAIMPTLTVARTTSEWLRDRRSWCAALMILMRRV